MRLLPVKLPWHEIKDHGGILLSVPPRSGMPEQCVWKLTNIVSSGNRYSETQETNGGDGNFPDAEVARAVPVLVHLEASWISGEASQYRIDAGVVLITFLREHVEDPKILFVEPASWSPVSDDAVGPGSLDHFFGAK